MGAWGAIAVFDVEAFATVVVPAVRAGHEHPLIAAEIEQSEMDCEFVGLAEVAARFDAFLMVTELSRSFQVLHGEVHDDEDQEPLEGAWGYEQLVDPIEALITRHAITHIHNFGLACYSPRSIFSCDFQDVLFDQLLTTLDKRATFWTHSFGGFGEGVNGWLSVGETQELQRALPRWRRWLQEESRTPPEPHRAAAFCDAVDVAVATGRGLLWGQDLNVLYGERLDAWGIQTIPVGDS